MALAALTRPPQIQVRRDETCKVQCKLLLTEAQAKAFRERIQDEYRVTMCAAAACEGARRA